MKRSLLSILLVTAIILIVSLVYFFYTTTTASSPTVMTLNMPKDENTDSYQNVPTRLTVLLLKNDMVYGYYASTITGGRSLELKEVRDLIQEGIKKYTRDSLVVIIKPGEEATYKNTVDMLDEMAINDIKKYSLVDISNEEKEFIAKTGKK